MPTYCVNYRDYTQTIRWRRRCGRSSPLLWPVVVVVVVVQEQSTEINTRSYWPSVVADGAMLLEL